MKSEPTGGKARGIIFTSNESATAASACPGLCAPETPLYRRMVLMRKRNHRIVFYLDDTEYNALERKVKMTSLSREGFIRKAIQNAQIHTAPPADLPVFIREIRRIGINIDHILRIAHTKAPLQVPDLKKALTNLSELEDKIDAVYYGGNV
jgi:hypothetical protein